MVDDDCVPVAAVGGLSSHSSFSLISLAPLYELAPAFPLPKGLSSLSLCQASPLVLGLSEKVVEYNFLHFSGFYLGSTNPWYEYYRVWIRQALQIDFPPDLCSE